VTVTHDESTGRGRIGRNVQNVKQVRKCPSSWRWLCKVNCCASVRKPAPTWISTWLSLGRGYRTTHGSSCFKTYSTGVDLVA